MTAIAYRDGVLAADSSVGGRECTRGTMRKIFRSPTGTLAAAAGFTGAIHTFARWVERGDVDRWMERMFNSTDAAPISEDANQFEGIVVGRRDGGEFVVLVDHQGRAVQFDATFYATGCCVPLLTGAMAAGASAENAVRIAIEYDDGCGGEVQVERLDGARRAPVAEE